MLRRLWRFVFRRSRCAIVRAAAPDAGTAGRRGQRFAVERRPAAAGRPGRGWTTGRPCRPRRRRSRRRPAASPGLAGRGSGSRPPARARPPRTTRAPVGERDQEAADPDPARQQRRRCARRGARGWGPGSWGSSPTVMDWLVGPPRRVDGNVRRAAEPQGMPMDHPDGLVGHERIAGGSIRRTIRSVSRRRPRSRLVCRSSPSPGSSLIVIRSRESLVADADGIAPVHLDERRNVEVLVHRVHEAGRARLATQACRGGARHRCCGPRRPRLELGRRGPGTRRSRSGRRRSRAPAGWSRE